MKTTSAFIFVLKTKEGLMSFILMLSCIAITTISSTVFVNTSWSVAVSMLASFASLIFGNGFCRILFSVLRGEYKE